MPDPEEPDDLSLLRAHLAGRPEAFDALARRHAGHLLRVARLMTGEEALAADVVQEALLSIHRHARSFDAARGEVRPWLYAITRNAARRALRSRRERSIDEPEAELIALGVAACWGSESPEAAVSRVEQADRLARALAAMPIEEREAVLLRDLEGLDGSETAAALGLSLPAMKSRLDRGRLRLMALLRRSEGDLMASDRVVGALRCSEVVAQLSDFVDGELSTADVARIEEHLRGCDVCERFGGRFAHQVAERKRALGSAPGIDEALVERLRAALLSGGPTGRPPGTIGE